MAMGAFQDRLMPMIYVYILCVKVGSVFFTVIIVLLCVCVAEKLDNVKVNAPEVTQSEIGQKQKLKVVLDYISHLLQFPLTWRQRKWSVDSESASACCPRARTQSPPTPHLRLMSCLPSLQLTTAPLFSVT